MSDELIAAGIATVDKLAAVADSERTYANSVLPIASFESDFSTFTSNISFYRYTSTDAKQREQSIALEAKFDEFSINLYMREDFYNAMVTYR